MAAAGYGRRRDHAAAAMATKSAGAGDPSFMNNVPDPLLGLGESCATFKYTELEEVDGQGRRQQLRNGATVKQLPISKGIAGVSMTA